MIKPRVKMVAKYHANVMKQLFDAFRFASKEDVLVGIPAEKTAAYGSGITNVQLMYIHTHGSPINNIPPRPTIEPAILDPSNRRVLQDLMGDSLASAFRGNVQGGRAGYARAGQMAVNMVRARFGGGSLAPNAPITVSGGWMRNKVTGGMIYVKGKGSSAPLIDTGQLRNSITYVIRPK